MIFKIIESRLEWKIAIDLEKILVRIRSFTSDEIRVNPWWRVQRFDKTASYRTNACHRVSLTITCWTTFWNVPPTQRATSGTPLVRLYNWIFANCMIARAHDKTVDVCVCAQRHFITGLRLLVWIRCGENAVNERICLIFQ